MQEHLLLKQGFVLIRLVWLLLSKNPISAESIILVREFRKYSLFSEGGR